MTARSWHLAEPAPEAFLRTCHRWPASLATVLWQRGLRTMDEVEDFIHPHYDHGLHDPWAYQGMRLAVDRILAALQAKELITVYGDYDADGVTSTVIMVETLRALGGRVSWYVPERLAEGYGLNVAAVERLAKRGTKLLVTVDCGTTSVVEIDRAKALGLDVIVIDHHHQPDHLPAALAIINPMLAGGNYPTQDHSSAGVAFTVVRALLEATNHGRQRQRVLPAGWEKWLLDLVAISTVADMVPLRGENRLFVHFGLVVLRKTRRPGVRALLAIMGQDPTRLDEQTIGFQIAPRLNAAGRLHHASLAVELLLTADADEAYRLAAELHHVNGDRQRLTELAMAEALEQVAAQGEQPAYAAFAPHWSPGIIGLVAGRLMERVWRPVVVMTENDGAVVGSGRSIPGVDIMVAMDAGRQHFLRFGGHAAACGFTLAEAGGRIEFAQWWQTYMTTALPTPPDRPLTIDARLTLADATTEFFDGLDQLAPFGVGNTRPIFQLDRVTVTERSTVGTEGKHLRLRGRQGNASLGFIGFRRGSEAEALRPDDHIDLVVEPSWNVWNGRREPQMKIIDWRPAA